MSDAQVTTAGELADWLAAQPDITADTPVGVLWRDGEGGFTGARAQARLAACDPPVTTVGGLCAMDEEDILAIPRAGAGVLAEIRRALAASGLALFGERAPTRSETVLARRAGQYEAMHKDEDYEPIPETAAPVTAAEYAALVKDLRAELEAAEPERRRELLARPPVGKEPGAFAGRPWAWKGTGVQGASEITGYSPVTIRAYHARARKERYLGTATHRSMPEPGDSGWIIGELALWMATVNEGQSRGDLITPAQARQIRAEALEAMGKIPILPDHWADEQAEKYGVSAILIKKIARGEHRAEADSFTLSRVRAIWQREGRITRDMVMAELGGNAVRAAALIKAAGLAAERKTAEDGPVAEFLARQIAGARRYISADELLRAAHRAGVRASGAQLRRLLPDVRAAEMRRRYQPTGVARARGESLRADGLLTVAQVAEDWAVTPNTVSVALKRGQIRRAVPGRGLIDPARLRARKDGRRTPVDKDHPKARLDNEDQEA